MRKTLLALVLLTLVAAAQGRPQIVTLPGVTLTVPAALHVQADKAVLDKMRDGGADVLKVDKSKLSKSGAGKAIISVLPQGTPNNPSLMVAIEADPTVTMTSLEYAQLNRTTMQSKVPAAKMSVAAHEKIGRFTFAAFTAHIDTPDGPVDMRLYFAFDPKTHRGFAFSLGDAQGANLATLKKVIADARFEGGFQP